MNQYRAALAFIKAKSPLGRVKLAAFLAIAGLLFSLVLVLAHHPFGGETPDILFERFLSGIGHSVTGLDYLAFVIAAGLLAAAMGRSRIIFHGYAYGEAIVGAEMGPLVS